MSQSLADLQDRTFAKATAATDSTYPPERRLTAEQLTAYLDRRTYAVVGTARPDGRPHSAMSMYVRRDTTFWLPTVSGSVRARNLREQPWLTLVVPEADGEAHIVVILEGPAETVPVEEAPEDVRAVVEADWPRAWIRFRAERLLSYAAEGAQP
ncbi:pyridoxamine 5'-phosphate oxidase family protein [Streptomycetaceae bacterium NBC_01309]